MKEASHTEWYAITRRFAKYVAFPDDRSECWEWSGFINNTGYGALGINGKSVLAHRISWQIHHGSEPPADKCVCHSCDNRRCVNPKHLWLGSVGDNNHDRHSKGRSRGGVLHGEQNPLSTLNEDIVKYLFNSPLGSAVLAKQTGVSIKTISDIRRGISWSSVTGKVNERRREWERNWRRKQLEKRRGQS